MSLTTFYLPLQFIGYIPIIVKSLPRYNISFSSAVMRDAILATYPKALKPVSVTVNACTSFIRRRCIEMR